MRKQDITALTRLLLFSGWEWINDERGDLYMDKDWAEKNKEIQKLISKEATFNEAIDKLIAFREEIRFLRHLR